MLLKLHPGNKFDNHDVWRKRCGGALVAYLDRIHIHLRDSPLAVLVFRDGTGWCLLNFVDIE
jgi:hypothetical protein